MKQSFHSHFDRDLTRAGSAILNEAVRRGLLSQHEAMIHDHQWTQFSIYAKESHEVDVLELVNEKLVRQYGGELCTQVYHGNLSVQTAEGLLETVSSVMALATSGGWKVLMPDIGFPGHARITAPHSLDQAKFEAAVEDVQTRLSEHLAVVLMLVRHLGISLREAFFFDAQAALEAAKRDGCIPLESGKEGPYRQRIINISMPKQIAVLETASAAQDVHRYPQSKQTWRLWKQNSLPAAKDILLFHGLSFCDCRAAFACELYKQWSGHEAPILGGSAPNIEDLEARDHVAYELGKLRIWETDAYVGARANLRKEAATTGR
ncbi:integrase [Pseudomonas aeruginosa]|uniref:integrase n=1 Tax=Pseudomonas aeruginosa TaxID=287 RepID=UPI000F52E185|nr:integrase [Pseudomonas aeruginosa]MDI2432190.1 integrase [Pseudomonas aeruginosa]RQC36281.1 integrase [Pseudomonas aeruginosa]UXH57378.1 integrase [Pseudomonas aeruginosa]